MFHTALRLSKYIQSKASSLVQGFPALKAPHRYIDPALNGSRGADITEMLSTLKNFVRRELPGIIGEEQKSPIKMEMPLEGAKSLVLIVTCGKQKVLLRTYPPAQRGKARSHVSATNLLVSHGVKVPALIHTTLDAGKDAAAILVLEQFIEGEAREAPQLSDDNVREIARQLAQLHSIRGEKWGRLHEERSEPFFPAFTERVNRDLSLLEKQRLLTSAERKSMSAWFSQFSGLFEENTWFSLTHNDLHSANGLFTADGSYYVIDVGQLQWGPAAREVVRAYYRLLGGHPDKIDIFNEAYFGAMDPVTTEHIRRYRPVYEAFHRVSTCVKLSTKMQKHHELSASNTRRCKALLTELRALTQS